MNDSLVVSEIYPSIQGESSWAGLPCTFVRLAGCNLRCVWCDSAFTFHGGERLSVGEVLERALAPATPLVEVTGGEPLLQPAVHVLMEALASRGKTVLLETSGSLDISGVDPRVIRIVDLKCPDSGEGDRNLWSNLARLDGKDEVKFVIASRRDYEWARSVLAEHRLDERAQVMMGVVFGSLAPQDLVAWILEDRLEVRFQLQMHKLVWPPEARGV